MSHAKWGFALLAVVLLALVGASTLGGGATSPAVASDDDDGVEEICGVVEAKTIMTDARLVCDVTCPQATNQPCIRFGRSGLTLSLNGFKMTGPSNTPDLGNCVTTGNFLEADGVHSTFDRSRIKGPGVIQRMKRHGVALFTTTPDFVEHSRVDGVTSHQNCFSGIWLVRVRKSVIQEVVSAKNSGASSFFPCGGICVTNSDGNRIRHSEFFGNGSASPGPGGPCATPAGVPNDFGLGLVGTSSGNRIEENGFGGNINGVFVCPGAGSLPSFGPNLIKDNVIAGNPPVQVSADHQGADPVGSDIRDFAPPTATRYRNNLCLTYLGATTPPPCPNVPEFSGHRNPDDDD
jgi:hypothetical protein